MNILHRHRAPKRVWYVLRESSAILLGQLFVFGGGIVATKLLTSSLTLSDFGLLALGLSFVGLLQQVAFGPINSGVVRYFGALVENSEEEKAFVVATKRILLQVMLISVLVLVIASLPAFLLLGTTVVLVFWICGIYGVIIGISTLFSGLMTSKRKRIIVAMQQSAEPWLKIITIYLIITLGYSSIYSMLAAFILSAFLVLYISAKNCPINWRESNTIGSNEASMIVRSYVKPLVISGATGWLLLGSQYWALGSFCELKDVGYYSVLFQIGYAPMMMVGGLISTYLLPIVFEYAADRKNIYKIVLLVKRGCWLIAGITVVAIFIYWQFGDKFIEIIAGKKYAATTGFLPYFALASGVLQISILCASIVLAIGETKLLLPINILGNSLIAVLYFAFTWHYQLDGLVCAILLGSIIHFIWNLHTVKCLLNTKIAETQFSVVQQN